MDCLPAARSPAARVLAANFVATIVFRDRMTFVVGIRQEYGWNTPWAGTAILSRGSQFCRDTHFWRQN